MVKKNCWEVKRCGRQPGGENVEEFGLCPAAISSTYNGVNDGMYGGRFCWAVAGTFCGGNPQGTYAKKLPSCLNCEFLKQVQNEEGRAFILIPKDADIMTKKSA